MEILISKTVVRGISTYRIDEVVYRLFEAPRNSIYNVPSCLQTYFYDSEEQIQHQILRVPVHNGRDNYDVKIFASFILL